ncbi:DUF4373 domain-containing protein [Paraflavitalea sp. CAU 1676]|uniref:DUF4373 domain-containing protein n=1 Tax=Paraflavitalea sp. CAU 1676 TaxID=3032598 RepID=UPI0023DBF183|nr:DUF4373 domain-containing protein [Paraflavitalea sp. CAU 1676]MDF2189312.1 DUF4373 domain-containing protein [Paraflavitalea sp. CAU 1676]
MGRTAKQGISFYRMNSGHIRNKKVRLLYNEFDSDGYYIWSCLLDYAYEKWGYYFDCNDKEELELFASEFCKKKVTKVKEVIDGCLRRDLFNQVVYEMFGVLTSDMMQDTFVKATAERRSAGTRVSIHENYLLLSFSDDVPLNLVIVQPKKGIDQPNNSENQPKNTQSREEESRVEEMRLEQSPTGGAPAKPSRAGKEGRKGAKDKAEETEPYWDQLVKVWFDFGKEKFGVEPSFVRDDPKIFKRLIGMLKKRAEKAGKEWSETTAPQRLRYFLDGAYADPWLKEHFLLKNLETQFDKVIQNQTARAKESKKAEQTDIQYLYDRYLEGGLQLKVVTADHYEQLVGRGIMDKGYYESMVEKRKRQLNGSNQGNELRLLQAYTEGKNTDERKADIPALKCLAVWEAFGIMKTNKLQTVPTR